VKKIKTELLAFGFNIYGFLPTKCLVDAECREIRGRIVFWAHCRNSENRHLNRMACRSGRYEEVKIFYPTGTRTPNPPGRPARRTQKTVIWTECHARNKTILEHIYNCQFLLYSDLQQRHCLIFPRYRTFYKISLQQSYWQLEALPFTIRVTFIVLLIFYILRQRPVDLHATAVVAVSFIRHVNALRVSHRPPPFFILASPLLKGNTAY
jgi:hypothetical protein